MKDHLFLSSVTRISDLATVPFSVNPLPRGCWSATDYVVGEVCSPPGPLRQIELVNGRYARLMRGDLVVGALGVRQATLEAVGDWRAVEADLRFEALTNGGLFGKCTSKSPLMPQLTSYQYRGHVVVEGRKAAMRDFAAHAAPRRLTIPVILLIGTSMSSGKTTSGRVVISRLKKRGLRVAAAKVTGACRYGEILSMADAGADCVFDFVDAGLPSTVCPEEEFAPALASLLSRIAAEECDVAVVEAGASPLEPYNGAAAVRKLNDNIRLTILCASDPYAVVGVQSAFGLQCDLVAGVCTNTTAAIELIQKLAGAPALNLLRKESLPELDQLLRSRLGLEFDASGPNVAAAGGSGAAGRSSAA